MQFDEEEPEEGEGQPRVEPHLTIVQAVGLAILVVLVQILLARLFVLVGVPFLSSNHWLPLAVLQLIAGVIAAQAGSILSGISVSDLLIRNRMQLILLLPLRIASFGILILASELGNILNAIHP